MLGPRKLLMQSPGSSRTDRRLLAECPGKCRYRGDPGYCRTRIVKTPHCRGLDAGEGEPRPLHKEERERLMCPFTGGTKPCHGLFLTGDDWQSATPAVSFYRLAHLCLFVFGQSATLTTGSIHDPDDIF